MTGRKLTPRNLAKASPSGASIVAGRRVELGRRNEEDMSALTKSGLPGVVTATLEAVVNWGRVRSMWPLFFGLACCGIEAMATGASHYDLARFGMEYARPTPRQSDLMIVAGRVTRKMAPVIRRLYDQMADPKWVISMGECASCGGVFNNYAAVQGADEILPVDVYVAGCPPRPEALLHGILTLHEKVKAERPLSDEYHR